MRYLLAVLLLFASPAFATNMIARDPDGTVVRLSTSKCQSKAIRKLVSKSTYDSLYAGTVTLQGKKTYPMCWAVIPSGYVALQYEDGDNGLVPITMFQPESGA